MMVPGSAIGANIRLVREIAQGGMGSVWIAEHLALRTQVAVKFMVDPGAESSVTNRFEQEGATAARIKSPHVVQIFDHGITDEGTSYIVMEWLEGETLGARLHRQERLSPPETAAILVQVCRALSQAHGVQVVHRDIKPDNIFLTDSAGELFVKVLDFGIAKNTAEGALGMTGTGVTMGTPYYMSPEQIVSAKNVTAATDLWAVAAVAYRCLTGRLPFDGETYGALAVAIASRRYTPPSEIRPDLPAGFDGWFARAFGDSRQRCSSAKEAADTFLVAGQVSLADVAGMPSGFAAGGFTTKGSAMEDGSARPVNAHTVTASPLSGAAIRPAGSWRGSATSEPKGNDRSPTSPSISAVTNGEPRPDALSPSIVRSKKALLVGMTSGVIVALGGAALVSAVRSSLNPPPESIGLSASADRPWKAGSMASEVADVQHGATVSPAKEASAPQGRVAAASELASSHVASDEPVDAGAGDPASRRVETLQLRDPLGQTGGAPGPSRARGGESAPAGRGAQMGSMPPSSSSAPSSRKKKRDLGF